MFGRKSIKNELQTEAIGLNPTVAELCKAFNVSDISDISTSNLTAATYYACMQIRCNAIAKLPIRVMQHDDANGAKVLKDSDLYELLKFRPNPYTNAHDFMWATEYQRLEHGNAFWVKDFRNGKIQGLYLLDSTKVEIVIDNTELLSDKNAVYYIYNDTKHGRTVYVSDAICHFKNYSLTGIKGMPIKKYLWRTISQEKYAQNVINEKYKNGLQDPLVVTYTGDMNKTLQQKIKKKFDSIGGVQNAGKVVPIPSDFDIKQLDTRLVNNQFFQINGLTTRHIANAFGVKSFQLNDMEKSTYSNIEQQNRAFYSDTIQNVLTTYEQEMDYKLLFDKDRAKGIYTNINADVMLRSDLKSRYEAYKIGIESGFKTVAECRAKENDPFIEGTDKLIYGNGAAITFADIGKQYTKGGEV